MNPMEELTDGDDRKKELLRLPPVKLTFKRDAAALLLDENTRIDQDAHGSRIDRS